MPLVNLNRKLDRQDRRRVAHSKGSRKKWLRWGLFLMVVILAIYLPLRGIYTSLRQIQVAGGAMNESFKNEDLDSIKTNLQTIQSSARNMELSLNFLFWARIIPWVGDYYADARHFSKAANHELDAIGKVVDIMEPQKAELGFNGHPTPGQDRVVQAVKVLNVVMPRLDEIEPDLKAAAKEVESIKVEKYPETIGGRALRSRVEIAKNLIVGADYAVTKARPALEAAPGALGVPTAKNYLIIFQNDKELRATGGFMTAYAFMKLDQGRLSSSTSDDIYRLDEKLLEICKSVICPLTPPAPLVKYLPEADGKPRTAWSMRDSNLSPDVPTSMKTFEKMYSYIGGESFDGIILIDTHVVEELIKITGPIDIFGTSYSAATDPRCNCPNVVYELENYAQIIERGEQDRKAILGTLMQQILARSLGASTEKLPEFINAGVELANGKHIIFYMHDPQLQASLSQLHWTGEIQQEVVGDYLMINDSNFAGGKSNLYVQQEVNLDIDSNKKTSKLTLKYSNPQVYSTWLNGINRDYIRVYVPEGSKLLSSKGSQVAVSTIESELGKTVFEGFIQVRPQNSVTVEMNYQLPENYEKDGKYPLLIQKQPGKPAFKYTINVNGKTQNVDLVNDIQISL